MNHRVWECDRGAALIHVLLLLIVLTAVAGGAAAVARLEVLIAGYHRDEREAAYAAQAMLAVTTHELSNRTEWDGALSGARPAAFADGDVMSPRPLPAGGTIAVCCGPGTLTARARSESGRRWQPFAWLSMTALSEGRSSVRVYLVAWILDDEEESDGDVSRDSNGRIFVRVEAATPFGLRKTAQAVVQRGPRDPASGVYSPGVQMLTWREIR